MFDFKHFIPGASAGFTGVLVGYPLDTIKVRMQTGYYPHMWECINKTYINEGAKAFYRGATVPFISITIKRSYQYYLFNYFQKLDNESLVIKTIQNPVISGMMSGVLGTPLGCPMHIIKIRMQNSDVNVHRNLRHCINHIYNSRGISGFFEGFKVNMFKDCLFGGLYLGTMGYLSNCQTNHQLYFDTHPYQANIISLFKGGIAGCVTWTILFPIDTIKTTIQSGLGFNVFINNVNTLGPLYMWRGLKPVIIRTFPASALSMLIYDKVYSNIYN